MKAQDSVKSKNFGQPHLVGVYTPTRCFFTVYDVKFGDTSHI